MRAVSRFWWLLIAAPAIGLALLACDSGGDGSSSGDDADNDDCRFKATLSGGIQGELKGTGAVCAYTSGAVTMSELGQGDDPTVVLVNFNKVEAGQTGSFPVTIDLSKRSGDRWTGANCTIDIVSNVKTEDAGGSSMFESYLMKGTGTCSTPAMHKSGEAGAKEPITIGPFSFTFKSLNY
jgi:hypothetical protein